MMNDYDVRESYIDSAAGMLLENSTHTVEQWHTWADNVLGTPRAIYRRCALIQAFRDQLVEL